MTVAAVGFRQARVQNGYKPKPVRYPLVRAAVIGWRDIEPFTMREEIAVICDRSLSTIDRWVRGDGEPTVSDILSMENHKPGIVEMLFANTKRKRAGRKAARA